MPYTVFQVMYIIIYVILLRIISRMWLPREAAILHCSEPFMLAFIVTPKQ